MWLYLLVGIFGGFAQGFVYPTIYAAGDAATTAGDVLANSDLVRAGVISDLFQATMWVFVALLAGGVFGATLRWSALPWFAGPPSRARTLGLVANLALCALIIAVAYV